MAKNEPEVEIVNAIKEFTDSDYPEHLKQPMVQFAEIVVPAIKDWWEAESLPLCKQGPKLAGELSAQMTRALGICSARMMLELVPPRAAINSHLPYEMTRAYMDGLMAAILAELGRQEPRPKRLVVIEPDGTERLLEGAGPKGLPEYGTLREILGGPVELVRVLRADLPGFAYTYMAVHEEGLLEGLPRNQKATDLYLAANRRAHPDAENPRAEAEKEMEARAKEDGFKIVDNPNTPPGYDEDPYIAGTVVWFDGWTVEELLEAGI